MASLARFEYGSGAGPGPAVHLMFGPGIAHDHCTAEVRQRRVASLLLVVSPALEPCATGHRNIAMSVWHCWLELYRTDNDVAACNSHSTPDTRHPTLDTRYSLFDTHHSTLSTQHSPTDRMIGWVVLPPSTCWPVLVTATTQLMH